MSLTLGWFLGRSADLSNIKRGSFRDEAGLDYPINAEHPDQRSVLLAAFEALRLLLAGTLKVQPELAASGIVAVNQPLAAAGASDTFTPPAGRGFKAWSRPTQDFAGSYQLECRPVAGGPWIVVLPYSIIAATPELQTFTENQAACPYRWNVTARTAGSVIVGIAA